MSQTIENRIVEMQFENKQFEQGVQESLSTLDKLKKSLKFDDAGKNLQDFSKNINKSVDLSGITNSLDSIKDKFSASGIAAKRIIEDLVDFAISAGKKIANAISAPFDQMKTGGWKRAMNIEDAKFQLDGLGIAWEKVASDIDYAVADTAYGLDVAAKACAQLSASSVKAGDDMKAALRGISGVAAMGNTDYESISRIFTKAAGNGRVMADELNRISGYGLNASASLANFFNTIKDKENVPEDVKKKILDLTKGLKVTEGDIREFASKSKISFKMFSYAMDDAFGEHAKKANETFFGAKENIKAALNKIGAEFATPIIKGAIPIFNSIRTFLNDLRKNMGPVFEIFSKIAGLLSEKITSKIEAFSYAFLKLGGITHIGNALKNVFTSLVKIVYTFVDAFKAVFPPAHNFNYTVVSVTKAIEDFSKKLIISDDTLITLRGILVSVFSVLKNLGTIIKVILPVVGKVLNILAKIAAIIVGLVAKLVVFVSNLDLAKIAMNALQMAAGLFVTAVTKIKEGLSRLKGILSDTSTVTGQFAMKLKDISTTVVSVIAGALYLAFTKIKEVISYFDTHDPLGSLITGFQTLISDIKTIPIIKDIVSGLQTTFGYITTMFGKLVELLKDFIKNVKSGMTIFQAFGQTLSTVIGGLVGLFDKLIDYVTGFFSSFNKTSEVIDEEFTMPVRKSGVAMEAMYGTLEKTAKGVNKFEGTFSKAKDSVKGFGSTILEALKKLDLGKIMLFGFATVVITLGANLAKLANSLSGVARSASGFVNKLGNFFENFGKKKSTFLENMMGISLGIGALTGALYVMSKIDIKTLLITSAILTNFIAMFGVFSAIGAKGGGAFASALASFASGIVVIIGALYALDKIKWQHLVQDAIMLGVIVTVMTTVSIILSKFAPKLTTGGLALLAFAGSVYILAKAIEVIGNVDLTNITNNWKGLTVVILGFAAFAAMASNVGLAAAVGLIGFILALKVLLKSTDTAKKYMGNIQKAFSYIADVFKSIAKYLHDGLKKVAEEIEESKTFGIVIGGAIASLIGVIIAIGFAGKGIKRIATSFVLIAAAIAGLMFVMAKISQMEGVKPAILDKAKEILETLLWFIGALGTVSVISDIVNKKGTNKGSALKDMRKMLTSMGFLMLSIGAFAAMIGTLDEAQFARAKEVLIMTEVLVGVLASIGSIITAVASRAGKTDVSFGTFGGIIAMIGAFIGAIAVLMYMFSSVNWEQDKTKLIAVGASLLGITVAISTILGIIARIAKNRKQASIGDALKTPLFITSIATLLAAIGTVVYELLKVTQKEGDLARAGKILGSLAAFMTVMLGSVIALQATSKRMLNTKLRQNAFMKTLAGVGIMVAGIATLAGIVLALKDVDGGAFVKLAALTLILGTLGSFVFAISKLVKDDRFKLNKTEAKRAQQVLVFIGELILGLTVLVGLTHALNGVSFDSTLKLGAISLVLGELGAFVFAISKLAKDDRFKINSKESKQIQKVMTYVGGLIVELAALVGLTMALDNVSVDTAVVKMQSVTLVLGELGAMIIVLEKLTKEADFKNIAKCEGLLTFMVGIFATLSAVFVGIDKLITSDAGEMLKKSETITLILGELGLIASGCAMLGRYANLKEVIGGEGILTAMVAIFELITLVMWHIQYAFRNGDAGDLLVKSETITLILAELGLIASGCGMLARYAGGGKIFLGEAALFALVGVFAVLVQVFKVIDRLNTEGIFAKSQSIILILAELGGIAAGLGLSVKWELLGAIGSIGLWAMLGCLAVLVQIFKVIDRLKTEGILAKSQTIILVLLELTLIAPLMLGDVFGLVGFLGLYAILGGFAILAQIFKVIDGLKTEGILAKSQTLVLVLLELTLMAPLMLFDVAGLVGFAGLYAILGAFAILAQIFKVIDGLHVDGLLAKSQTIVLVLLELEGLAAVLGVISPLAIASVAGIPSILSMCNAMVIIAEALSRVSEIAPDVAEHSIDLLVNALWSLIPLGIAGGLGGPGLVLLSVGIAALGMACGVAGNGLQVFAVAALAIVDVINKLIATGPGISTWCLSLSAGITAVSASILMASKSIVISVNTLITGIIAAIQNGARMIFSASGSIGDAMRDGLNARLDPVKWGKDLILGFVSGIRSGMGQIKAAVADVAKTVWSYLHFSQPEEGLMVDLPNWGFDAMVEYAAGISRGDVNIKDAVSGIGKTITTGLKNLNLGDIGESIGGLFGNGIANGTMPGLNRVLEMIGLVESRAQNLLDFQKSKAYTGVLSDYANQLKHEENQLNSQKQALDNVAAAQRKYAGRVGQTVEQSKYFQDRVKGVNDALKENKKAQNELLGVTEDTAEATDDLSDALGGLGDSAGGAGKGLNEAKDEIADFYDMISSSINLFEEFNTQTDLTSDKLLENMRSQINGLTEWSGQIAELAKRGIDEGLLKTLADMGPQGYQYTKAFVGMTEDQLKEASSLYEKSLILPQAVTAHVYSSFAYAGQQSADGFFNGLTKENVRDKGVEFAKNLLSGIEGPAGLDINSPSRKTYEDGVYAGLGFKDGLGSNAVMSTLKGTCNKICRSVRDWFKEGLPPESLYDIGRNLAKGLSDGIGAGEGDARSAINRLCTTIKNTAVSKQNLDERSPSHVFQKIGAFVVEGLAKGITDNTEEAANAIGKTSKTMIEEMRDAINKANEVLVEDVDDPVIKPVLDLSDIRYGSNQINSIFSQNRALSASTSFSNLQNAQLQNRQALITAAETDNSDVVGAIDSLKEDILSLKDAMTNMQMVLDTGTMVGAITPAIDQQLYTRQVYAGRGM